MRSRAAGVLCRVAAKVWSPIVIWMFMRLSWLSAGSAVPDELDEVGQVAPHGGRSNTSKPDASVVATKTTYW